MGEILKELPAVILPWVRTAPGCGGRILISALSNPIHAVEAAMNDDNHIFLVTQKDMQTEHAKQEDVYAIGVVAEIKQIVKMQNHVVRVIVESKQKAGTGLFYRERRIPKSTGCAGRGRERAGAAATGSGGSDAAQSAGKTVVLLYF